MFEIVMCMQRFDSPACQLNCFVIKTVLQHRYKNFSMTANLVLSMTTMGDKLKVKIGLAWKKLKAAMFWLHVFGDLGMTKNNEGYFSFGPKAPIEILSYTYSTGDRLPDYITFLWL